MSKNNLDRPMSPVMRHIILLGLGVLILTLILMAADHVFNIDGFADYYMISEEKEYECNKSKIGNWQLICGNIDERHVDPDFDNKLLDGDDYYCERKIVDDIIGHHYYTLCIPKDIVLEQK